jgi:hypothetical protein
MVKKYFPFSICIIIVVSIMFYGAVKPRPLSTGPAGPITAQMLNCKTGIYDSYQDFEKGTPSKKWTFLWVNTGVQFGGKISQYELLFKDESGKKVKISTAECWGWKCADGKLYKNSEFNNGAVKAIPFLVKYIAADHIMYEPLNPPTESIDPHEWFSTDLNSRVIPIDEFFKNHSR